MEASIAETMKEFQRCAETGELLDVKKTILALLIRSLSRSAFGVNIVLGRKANEGKFGVCGCWQLSGIVNYNDTQMKSMERSISAFLTSC